MDPNFWRTASYILVFVGTGLVLTGSIGTWYFGKLSEETAPYRQPIRSVSATVEVFVESAAEISTNYVTQGGLLAFGIASTPFLVTSSSQCTGIQQGDNRVLYRGIFQMDATDQAVGQSVYKLQESEYIQIQFQPIPSDAHVLGGLAVVTINSAVRLEFTIPDQVIEDGRILIRDLALAFSDFR